MPRLHLTGGNGPGSDACFSALFSPLPFSWDVRSAAAPQTEGVVVKPWVQHLVSPVSLPLSRFPPPTGSPPFPILGRPPLSTGYQGCVLAPIWCILPEVMADGLLSFSFLDALSSLWTTEHPGTGHACASRLQGWEGEIQVWSATWLPLSHRPFEGGPQLGALGGSAGMGTPWGGDACCRGLRPPPNAPSPPWGPLRVPTRTTPRPVAGPTLAHSPQNRHVLPEKGKKCRAYCPLCSTLFSPWRTPWPQTPHGLPVGSSLPFPNVMAWIPGRPLPGGTKLGPSPTPRPFFRPLSDCGPSPSAPRSPFWAPWPKRDFPTREAGKFAYPAALGQGRGDGVGPPVPSKKASKKAYFSMLNTGQA